MLARLDALLARAARGTRLLASVTPVDAAGERERLARELRAGRLRAPAWTYAPLASEDVSAVLSAADAELRQAPRSPLIDVYAERLEELATESALVAAVGTPRFAALAARRYAGSSASVKRNALAMAETWIAAEPVVCDAPYLASDARDPRSLLSRMRADVGRRRLPFRVVVDAALGSLAATGERTILVAAGRPTIDEDVARTVLHEIEGHACPRVRAAGLTPGIFAIGTARGTDDQEGLALVLENRHGFLTPRRRRELASRHLAVAWMQDGAAFVDVVARLASNHSFSSEEALRVTERAFRGSGGAGPGLGRERVYLEAFVRVVARLGRAPEDERVLAAGQVAVEALDVLRPLVTAVVA